MFGKLIFLLQTIYGVAFCYSVKDLYRALGNRYPLAAILYSADNIEYLQYLANINQNYFCDRNTDEKNVLHPVTLPSVITKTTCLQNNNAIEMNLVAHNQMGEWAISALNGFCTASTDEALCGLLEGEELAYPMAQWYPLQHEQIVSMARNNYIKRFYSRYWFNAEQPFLPQKWLENFKDDYFEEREELRNMAIKNYEAHHKFNKVRDEMGW